jgi:molybdopterin converting factor subunit 1
MRVLLFAQTRDAVGVPELEMKVVNPVTVEEFWSRLGALHPKLAPFRQTTRLARNGEYAGPEAKFTDSDEVALIPPVSGG